jgi:flagellin-like protein
MEKKGLSAVVTTLIIILLVLVAVGIIWVVVRNVVEEGGSTIDLSVKCLDVPGCEC